MARRCQPRRESLASDDGIISGLEGKAGVSAVGLNGGVVDGAAAGEDVETEIRVQKCRRWKRKREITRRS